MTLMETLAPKAPPVRLNESGTLRVGNTRVTMDSLVSFDSLSLAAIDGAIEYYLDHKEVVDEYIFEREKKGEAIREEIEAQPGYKDWRTRLLERTGRRE
jgi:hypothetical protein